MQSLKLLTLSYIKYALFKTAKIHVLGDKHAVK